MKTESERQRRSDLFPPTPAMQEYEQRFNEKKGLHINLSGGPPTARQPYNPDVLLEQYTVPVPIHRNGKEVRPATRSDLEQLVSKMSSGTLQK